MGSSQYISEYLGSDSTPASQLLTLVSGCREVGLCPARPAGNREDPRAGQHPCTASQPKLLRPLAMAVRQGRVAGGLTTRPRPRSPLTSLQLASSRLWSQESPGAASGEAPSQASFGSRRAPPPGPLGLACGPYFLFPTLQMYHNWGSTHSLTLGVWDTLTEVGGHWGLPRCQFLVPDLGWVSETCSPSETGPQC